MKRSTMIKTRNGFNVLLVRASYTKVYPIMESLKKAGYNIVVGMDNIINEAQFSILPNRIVHIVNPYSSEKLYIASVLKAIRKYHIDVVVPVGFIDFLLLSKYKNFLEKYTIIPVDSFEKIMTLSNKWHISELAESVGVNYPRTLLLKENVDMISIRDFIDEAGLPIVIKGLGDNSKPRFVSSLDRLSDEVDQRIKSGILLQEFIIGYGTGYFVLSYDGEPIAEFMHRRILEATPLGGASVKASSNFDPKLLYLGRRIVEKTKYTGVMMIEFKKSVETGEYYLMEINPKFWGSLELAYKAGVDFPRYLVDFFLKGEKPELVAMKNISFSWITKALSSYSKYGFKTMLEIAPIILPRSPLLFDLHPYDPPNFMLKVAYTSISILKSLNHKSDMKSIYLTEQFKKLLKEHKLDFIISDLDGTLVKLNISWKTVVTNALKEGLVTPFSSISESLIKYWLSNNKSIFTKLSEFVKGYEMKVIDTVHKDKHLISLLKTIKQKQLYFAVVSMQSKESVFKCLEKLGILDYVDLIVGREDTPIRSEALHHVIEKIKLNKPYYGIMFGDTLVDVKAALKVGLTPCIVVKNHIKKHQAKDLDISYTESVPKVLRLISNKN